MYAVKREARCGHRAGSVEQKMRCVCMRAVFMCVRVCARRARCSGWWYVEAVAWHVEAVADVERRQYQQQGVGRLLW